MDTLLYSLYTHSDVDQQQWSAQNILADSVKLCMYQNELIYSPNEELQLFVSTEKMIAGFVLRLPKNAHSLPHHLSQIFDTSDSYEKGYLFRKILVKPWIVRNIIADNQYITKDTDIVRYVMSLVSATYFWKYGRQIASYAQFVYVTCHFIRWYKRKNETHIVCCKVGGEKRPSTSYAFVVKSLIPNLWQEAVHELHKGWRTALGIEDMPYTEEAKRSPDIAWMNIAKFTMDAAASGIGAASSGMASASSGVARASSGVARAAANRMVSASSEVARAAANRMASASSAVTGASSTVTGVSSTVTPLSVPPAAPLPRSPRYRPRSISPRRSPAGSVVSLPQRFIQPNDDDDNDDVVQASRQPWFDKGIYNLRQNVKLPSFIDFLALPCNAMSLTNPRFRCFRRSSVPDRATSNGRAIAKAQAAGIAAALQTIYHDPYETDEALENIFHDPYEPDREGFFRLAAERVGDLYKAVRNMGREENVPEVVVLSPSLDPWTTPESMPPRPNHPPTLHSFIQSPDSTESSSSTYPASPWEAPGVHTAAGLAFLTMYYMLRQRRRRREEENSRWW